MTQQLNPAARKSGPPSAVTDPVVLTPKEAATLLKVSLSWLAKARMSGYGPPFIKVGRSVRYTPAAVQHWTKAHEGNYILD